MKVALRLGFRPAMAFPAIALALLVSGAADAEVKR